MPLRAGEHLIHKDITWSIIGALFEVHRKLGFGLLEHLYVLALERELVKRGHRVAREVQVTVYYDGEVLGYQRIDLLVDDKVIVEVKSMETLRADASRQLFNYLCATSLEVGLLLHFGRRAEFYRVVCQNQNKQMLRPSDSLDSARSVVPTSPTHLAAPSPSRRTST